MKALVYGGPGHRSWTDVPDPSLKDPQDAIVRVDAVTICGTDLHILKGDVPEVEAGRILGHEAVGTVVETGAHVHDVAVGQRVLVSCISACGRCDSCRQARYGLCTGGGGWVLGHTIDGAQAELVRVPFADHSLHRLPDEVSNEQALMLADILPTSYEVGVLAGAVSPGDVVVVVGAGPIGLAAILTSRLFSPSQVVVVDLDASRRQQAVSCGADHAVSPEDAAEIVASLTQGRGADVAIEAVGVPDTFELCTTLVRAGGHVANVGVHGGPAVLHLEDLWAKDVTITTGLVDTRTTPLLLRLVAEGTLDATSLCTHRFGIDEMQDAYDVFEQAADTGALKVALFNPEAMG
ncbi:alcohol dehydrogenase catalytic domain-containing protein [Nocardioides rubriscoriae]|uniref:alcohol dehydrogenase catalytic domain-containing protein n=1 Tax=Nocardioides rubriscoriae TaxID=642762 RepID=UPI0011DFA53F|nr:alcohol dehydrogenase catalytic domain-containing protein [Nocardioides rubriscoriae]